VIVGFVTIHGAETVLERLLDHGPGAVIGAIVSVVAAIVGFWGPLPSVGDEPELIVGFWIVAAILGAALGVAVQGIIKGIREERRKNSPSA
jgi:high-affinity Fe2+/Pb2+ permease